MFVRSQGKPATVERAGAESCRVDQTVPRPIGHEILDTVFKDASGRRSLLPNTESLTISDVESRLIRRRGFPLDAPFARLDRGVSKTYVEPKN